MKRTHSMRFKRLKKILKNFGLLWQALRKFNDDNGFFLSSGIAFNILINLIPFIMLLLALVGTYLYNDQEVLNHIRAYLRNVAPTLDPKIIGSLMDLIESRQIVGILGFVGLLWFSTWVFGSLRIALNIVFRVEKSRGMLRGIGVDLLMILLAGILLLVSMILSSIVTFLQGYQGQIPVAIGPTIQWILKYLLPFFLTYCMFVLIYKIIPNKRVHFTSALQAALFTEPALGTGQTSFRLVYRPSRRVLYFLWLIKYLGHFRFVGVLFFDDSRSGRGVCLFPGRRSTEINGLTRYPHTPRS